MNRNVRLALAAGALIVAACGDDSGTEGGGDSRDGDSGGSTSGDAGTKADAKNDPSTGRDGGNSTAENPSTGSGKCNKGEYEPGKGEVSLCGPATDDDGSCTLISELTGYTKFGGDLNLFPEKDGDLVGASCLESVGSLSIGQSKDVTSLTGLSNLKATNSLEIVGMDKLESLAGFEGLDTLVALTISGNDALSDLAGLPKGLKIGSLYVTGNFGLTSLDGLTASEVQITDSLAFENNPKLSSCKAAEFAKKFPAAELSNFGNLVAQCD
jgi:hypothetical protein